MTAIVVAMIATCGSVGAALVATRASARSSRHEAQLEDLRGEHEQVVREMGAELDACTRDRRQLRQLVQLIAGAFVGLLPERERLALLRAIDETVRIDGEAA